MSGSVYDVAIRIAAETKDFVKEIKGSTGMLKSMGVVAAGVFGAGMIKDATGKLYAYGTGIDTIRQKVAQLSGVQGDALNKITGQIKATSDVWNKDYNEVIKASNVLTKQMGAEGDQALKLIQQGMASGGDATGDFLQQIAEYAPMFKDAGLSAGALVAVVTQSVTSGIFSDKGADAIKESMLRIREMTTATEDALAGIGISSDEVQEKLQSGTWSYMDVLKLVSKQLGEFPAQSKQVGTAIADIFGGAGEDAGLKYLKTLKDIELDMDKIAAAGGAFTQQQLDQAAASEKLNTEMAALFGGLNNQIRDVKTTGTEMALGIVQNFDNITTAVKIGGVGLVSYKAFVLAANFSTMKWMRTLVITRKALIGVNTAIKANPIGIAIALLSAAGIAYLAYKDNVDETTDSQDGFNTKLGKTNSLIDNLLDKLENAGVSSITDFLDLDKLETKKLTAFKNEIEGLSKADLTTVVTQLKEKLGEVNREIADLEQDFDRVENADLFEPHIKALKTFQVMIGVAEKEIGTFSGKQAGWYASIDKEIKQVKKDINKVTEGDTDRLTVLQAQLVNLENQKKALKKLGDLPVELPMLKLDLETEDIDIDESDLQIVDDKAALVLANYNKELKQSAEYNALLGSSNSLLKDEIDLTTQAIESLIDNGYTRQSKEVKTLVSDLAQLQQEYKGSSAGFMQWVGSMQQGVGTVQQGISNITALGSAFDSLHQKQESGKANVLDYVSVMMTMANSILGTIQVVDAIGKAVKVKQGIDVAAVDSVVTGESTKTVAVGVAQTAQTAAIASAQASQATAVATSSAAQAAALKILGATAMGANAEMGISAAIASAASLPFPGNLIAMGAAFGVSTGLFTSAKGVAESLATPFASGGIVSGPTYALTGEYPGAQNNPEVIAPLDKLKKMIQPAGGVGGVVSFEIHGDVIRGVLNRGNRKLRGFN